MMEKGEKMETLYEKLGGYDTITEIIDDIFVRTAANKQLNRFFVGMGTYTKERTKQRVVELLCVTTGGPCFYTGRDMRTTHAGLNITENDWQIAVNIIGETLTRFNVPEQEKGDAFAALSRLKSDIVGI